MARLLVTNDDGIDSPGIAALAAEAARLGHDVLIAAPAWNSSGASASITGVSADRRLLLADRSTDFPFAAAAYAIEASPAMIVRAGTHGAFTTRPDLVLSGINDGPNTGRAILHSGTVGAALTAATHGCPSVAFSLGIATEPDYRGAVSVVGEVLGWVLQARSPITLNVNVPSGPPEALRGLRVAPLAAFGAVQTHITDVGDGYVGLGYEEIDPGADSSSDAALLAAGYATVTALDVVCEARTVDLSDLERHALAERTTR